MPLTGMPGTAIISIWLFARYGNKQVYLPGLNVATNSYTTVTSTAYPTVDYNYIHDKPVFGGEFSFNANAVALSINDPNHTVVIPNYTTAANITQNASDHVAMDAQWRRTLKDNLGQFK